MKRDISGRLISINPIVFKSPFRLVESEFNFTKIAINNNKLAIPARTIYPYPTNSKLLFEVRK